MKIAFASGKGGTGKTLFASNFAIYLARQAKAVCLLDADVEAPNSGHFLELDFIESWRHSVLVPQQEANCNGCKACVSACAFHALLPMGEKLLLFPELCHSCGACVIACPEGALSEVPREIGEVERFVSNEGIEFRRGVLDVGEARATPLVEAIAAHDGVSPPDEGHPRCHREITIIDSPPGTSCAAMAAVDAADEVILVTEPTPFGLHDLHLAAEMCRALNKEPKVIVNRSSLGASEAQLSEWFAQRELKVLGSLPFERALAAAYAKGAAALDHSPALWALLEELGRTLLHIKDPQP